MFTILTIFKNRAVAYTAAALLAIFSLIYWHKHSVNVAVSAERERITAAYEQAKIEAIAAAIASSNEAIIAAKKESDIQNEKVKRDAANLLANYRSGAVRLSVPARCASPVVSGTQSDTSTTVGEARAELSEQSVEFFVGEAKRANEEVIERNELIEIVQRLKQADSVVK